jgi:multiple sugar transport system permease protein
MTTTARRIPRESQHNIAYLMMLPAASVLLIFLLVPFIMAFYLSLTNQRLISPTPAEFIGLSNYTRMLRLEFITLEPERDSAGNIELDEAGNIVYPRARTILRGNERYDGMAELTQVDIFGRRVLIAAGDPRLIRALINNFYFALVIVPVQSSFALFLAILVNQKLRGMNFFRTVYFSPVVTTMAVVSVLWFFLYNPNDGLINAVLQLFGIGPFQWLQDPRSAMPAIMLLSVWQGVGFQMVIYLAGLQEIPDSLYEASAIDGANRWQQFRFITLPSLRNTTIFIVISSTILAFKLFTQVEVMTFGTGGPDDSTVTMMLHLVSEGFKNQRVGYASAIAVLFIIIVLAVSLTQRQLFNRNAEAQ